MFKKIILTIFLSLLIFNVKGQDASAATIISINDYDNIYNQGLFYDASTDSMKMTFYGTRARSYSLQFYHGTDFQSLGTFRKTDAPTGTWLTAVNLTCVGGYDVKIFDAFDELLLEFRALIDASDLQDPACNSDGDGDKDVIEESDCGSLICECIAQLERPLDDIKESVDSVVESVDAVKDSVDAVKDSVDSVKEEVVTLNQTTSEIKEVLVDFSEEFKTSIDYSIPDSPNVDNILEENKPVQNETPFYDENIYFKDEGDAPDADPGKLPQAPDIKDWDGFKPEEAFPPDKEQEKDTEFDREKENDKDKELSKDNEFQPDLFQKDSELLLDVFDKSPELPVDSFESDGILGSDPVGNTDDFSQTEKFNNTNEFDNTHKYNQTNFMGGGN